MAEQRAVNPWVAGSNPAWAVLNKMYSLFIVKENNKIVLVIDESFNSAKEKGLNKINSIPATENVNEIEFDTNGISQVIIVKDE